MISDMDLLVIFLPGWELSKIRPENYAQGYGFITDYMAEIFTCFRRRNYQTIVNAHTDLAFESRQRVIEQLAIQAPTEFQPLEWKCAHSHELGPD